MGRIAAPHPLGPCHAGSTSPTWTRPLISAFLDHIERERGNTIRSRNTRLAAMHSLFSFAALRHPEHTTDIERVLAIPPKRADQTIVTFLTAAETEALLAAPTGQPGPAARASGPMPGCCSRSRPAYGPPSSPP